MHKPAFATLTALVMSISVAVAQSYDKPAFPRLGGYNIGGPQQYNDPAYRRDLARLDFIILNSYPGWEAAKGMSMQSTISDIKAKNPRIKVFLYVNVNERNPDAPAWQEAIGALDRESWWLYDNGTGGTRVTSTWAGNLITNYTLAARPNLLGERYVDWYPKWAYKQFFANTPAADGAYTDNFFWEPRVYGDWDRDGVKDSPSSDAVRRLHREGMRRHVENLRKLMPGKLQLGNVGGWGADKAVFPEYAGLLNGGVLEHYIGKSWSPEGLDWQGKLNSYGTWDLMMRQYRKVIRNLLEPRLLIFNQMGDPRNYQAFRYGFGSCLLDDAYYQFSDATGPGIYSSVPWFDEYDHELGDAVKSPPLTPWKSGVYRRDFTNGIVLVNPRGNGPVTVELEKEFRRIAGKQDPAVNNGQLTRTVSLKDRDGIVLLSTEVMKRPEPPRGIVFE